MIYSATISNIKTLTESYYLETYILYYSSLYPLPHNITLKLHQLIDSNQCHHLKFGLFWQKLSILDPVPVFS